MNCHDQVQVYNGTFLSIVRTIYIYIHVTVYLRKSTDHALGSISDIEMLVPHCSVLFTLYAI